MHLYDDNWKHQREMLTNRIIKNQRRLRQWCKQESISCYRVYNSDIPEIPLQIDIYETHLHVASLTSSPKEGPEQGQWAHAMTHAAGEALRIPENHRFLKQRHRSKGGSQYAPVNNARKEFDVTEGGLRFRINLSDYLDTGLFLDHRFTRQLVRNEAKGKRILNLFAYTGSFSVYAAAGGAATTTSIDLSNRYLDIAKTNLDNNGFTGFNHRLIKGDALELLQAPSPRDRFDLIVLDPPTVSKSKAMTRNLVVQRDHPWMIQGALRHLVRGGVLYFSTNFTSFKPDFSTVNPHAIEEITPRTHPRDFGNKRPHRCWRIVK